MALTGDTIELQQLVDSSSEVDLGGAELLIDYIVLNPDRHNGLRIRNGTVRTRPDRGGVRRFGCFELVKNATWRGKRYPDSPLKVTFEDMNFLGGWTSWTPDVHVNRDRAKDQGFNCAGINVVAGRVDHLGIRNCSFGGMRSGVIAQQTINLTMDGNRFFNIATQCIGSVFDTTAEVPQRHEIRQTLSHNVGSLFDFSAPLATSNMDGAVVPVAIYEDFCASEVRGRTKTHGRWNLFLSNGTIDAPQDGPTQYPAFSFPVGREILVDNVDMNGFLVGGISAPAAGPRVRVRNSRIRGGMMAFNCSCPLFLESIQIEGCHLPWGDSTKPAEACNVTIRDPLSVEQQARCFVLARQAVREWNVLHGTTYDPNRFWFMTNAVKAEVLRLEALGI